VVVRAANKEPVMGQTDPDISVVIPVYNEAPNLKELLTRIVATLEKLGRTFEVIAVDDGSSDESLQVLKEIRSEDHRLRIVRLARNFGQTPAVYAGLAHVRGGIIVSIDADLQNPPEEIPKLVNKLDEGYEVVQGWRENRQDSAFRRAASWLLNALVSRLIGVKIRDLGCGMKAYRREVVDLMTQFRHHSRYVPAEIVWLGVRMAEVKVDHNERAGGESKYGVMKLLKLNFDMVASVTTAPVKFIGLIGWLFALVGFAMGVRITILRILWGNWNDLAMVSAVFFVIGGVQMIATSLICEYISRIFVEVQGKPYFIVKEVIE
jgi:undecaprenyl-phosphate 4-deoxy-4-formamido-L-arabinose transferase